VEGAIGWTTKGRPHYPIEVHLIRLFTPPVHTNVLNHVAGASKREFTIWAHESTTLVEDHLVSLHVPSSGVYPTTLVTFVDLLVCLKFVGYFFLFTVCHDVVFGLRRVFLLNERVVTGCLLFVTRLNVCASYT